ncbi:MAG: D-alanine--D-alanine ligase [Chthoniobacter sp.]|nr:D-alanine--D-alanine ligase [Chthoniobacter sp.]
MSLDLTNKKIAVLMGGPGSERKVSLASGAGVANALRQIGADVTEVDVTGPEFVVPPDTEIAFNVIHGTFGEDGQLQRLLESRGVAYTGEGVRGSELAIDKIATKHRLVEHGVPTAPFEILRDGAAPTLSLPFVIKAPREGSSVGIYILHEASEVAEKVQEAAKFGSELMVEKYVEGRELTVGVVGDQALPIIEIRAKKGFYDFDNKYPFLNPNAPGADHFCPAPLDADLAKRIQEMALAAHRALGLEVYSRVDLLLTAQDEPFVLEVNTIPGMTPSSLLPEAAAAVGISYPELCRRIVELSLQRPRLT